MVYRFEKLFLDYIHVSYDEEEGELLKRVLLEDDELYVFEENKKGQFYFRLLNGSKQLLCTGETYPTKAGCESAVESVKRFAETAVVTVKEEQDEE